MNAFGAKKKSARWKKAGFLVRTGVAARDVAQTGFEELDGTGLPVRIVDRTTGQECIEVLPAGCSLNLVRRTARGAFGYVKSVIVDVAPSPPPGKRGRHLGRPEDRIRLRRLVEWEDRWRAWADQSGARRDEEVDYRVLKAAAVAKAARYGEDGRLAALEDLEQLASKSANLRGFDDVTCRALATILGESAGAPLDQASARVVWRLAAHADRRIASLLWDERLVDALCSAPRAAHASALASCLASPAAARAVQSRSFDPVPCLLDWAAHDATCAIAADALGGWLRAVPAARAPFAARGHLRRLGPFLASPHAGVAAAVCRAASCVLRDARAAVAPADAAALVGPLAALCDRAATAVAARAAALDIKDVACARLALAPAKDERSDAPRLLAQATVALWSAARAAVAGDPTDVHAPLATHADQVARVCLAVVARAAAHLVDEDAEWDCMPAPDVDCACAPAPAPVEGAPPLRARNAAGVSAVGAALGTLAALGPWCFRGAGDVPTLCLALVEAARPRGSAACALAHQARVDADERVALVGGPAWTVMETAAACLSAFARSAPAEDVDRARVDGDACRRAARAIRTAEACLQDAGDDAEAAAALRRTAQHLACFIARCAARDDGTSARDPWRDVDIDAAVEICTTERSGKVRGHGCLALWSLLRRRGHRGYAARANAARLLMESLGRGCRDVDDAVALAALALLARDAGEAVVAAGGVERIADEAARAFARQRVSQDDESESIRVRGLAVAAMYAVVRGGAASEPRLAALDRTAMPIVVVLAADGASSPTSEAGLALRAVAVLLLVALCQQSLDQRAALQRQAGAGALERMLADLVVASAALLEGDAVPDEALANGTLAAAVRAVVVSTTAPAARKRLGADRNVVRALANAARHGERAGADVPAKVRALTEDAFRALLNLSVELTARPALCEVALPLLLKVAAYEDDSKDPAAPAALGDFARAALANLMCDGASRGALYHHQLAAASEGVTKQRAAVLSAGAASSFAGSGRRTQVPRRVKGPKQEIKRRADLYPAPVPLVPAKVATLLRGSALHLWQGAPALAVKRRAISAVPSVVSDENAIPRGVVLQMHEAFPNVCAAWDLKSSMNKNWQMLFERLDTDGSGTLHYGEFSGALAEVLEIDVAEDHLRELWDYVDRDKSGLVSIAEFQRACYLLLLDEWPVLDDATLTSICSQVDAAAVHEFSKKGSGVTSGNWFQVFNKFDTDGSGRLGFEELEGVARMRNPGLNLKENDLSTYDLKGLWKAIDDDKSGDVTVDEYMHFMKAHGPSKLGDATHTSARLLGGNNASRWRPPIATFCGVDHASAVVVDEAAPEEGATEEEPAPEDYWHLSFPELDTLIAAREARRWAKATRNPKHAEYPRVKQAKVELLQDQAADPTQRDIVVQHPAPAAKPTDDAVQPQSAIVKEAPKLKRKPASAAGTLAKFLARPNDAAVRDQLAMNHQTVEEAVAPFSPKSPPLASWVAVQATASSAREYFHFNSDGRRRTMDSKPPALVKWKRVPGARVHDGLFPAVTFDAPPEASTTLRRPLDGEGCYFYHRPTVTCGASAPDALLALPCPTLQRSMAGPRLAGAPPCELPPVILPTKAPAPQPIEGGAIPPQPLTLVTAQPADGEPEEEEEDWSVELSLFAQRQFQTESGAFDDTEAVAVHVLDRDWAAIAAHPALVELLEKCKRDGAAHDAKAHTSRLKRTRERAAAIEAFRENTQEERISGLEDIEVEALAELLPELEREIVIGEAPRPPSGLDAVLASVRAAVAAADFRRVHAVFDRYCACQNFLKIRKGRISRGSRDGSASGSIESDPVGSVVSLGTAQSQCYVEPDELSRLHEPHFLTFLKDCAVQISAKKARALFRKAADGDGLTRATFLHALIRVALRASKQRPSDAVAGLLDRLPAVLDGHRSALFYARDTERALGAHAKELQRLFVVFSASDDDATHVRAHVNGRLPLQKWLDLISEGDVLQTTYLNLAPQSLYEAFFHARPLSVTTEHSLAFVDFLEALSRLAAACADLPGSCDFSHPLSIEDALETERAEQRREAAEQARVAILAEQRPPAAKATSTPKTVSKAFGVDLAAARAAAPEPVEAEDAAAAASPGTDARQSHARKLDWLLRHLIARVALKRNGVLAGGTPLALVPKYLTRAQLTDPRCTRTSLDFPLWRAEQEDDEVE